ncbi:putative PTR family peptide transporter [Aspergillus fumigatus Af293]|uniref:PTR family peptide transporter, putative n=1 Tax=Aspergillus fumigatus (strain ATCC MYA-4609 / CBS 101355 / FGSC A1100 / Af293) TaxID=330879 RepID=Q4WL76_ASPFU|nr:PTR family peptide transporter, putative [Aspergillus fumigatus Af293]EAL89288.1 PTR family peptide transporter, putative [Aspergillus fumigatus Af293]
MDTSAEDRAERGRAPHVAQLSTASETKIATEDEIRELEHVAAKLPARVWLAATIGMAERFEYYGTPTLFQMRSNVAPIGFILGSILIAVGLGGVQASAQPFIEQTWRIRVAKNGKQVVEIPEVTIQYIYNVYYWMVNVGSLGSIATTLMERYIGFWSAYLLDLCAVMIAVVVVHLAKPKFEYQLENHHGVVPWDKEFISELRGALSAFKICIGWPIFWVCMGQGAQVSISQAGQMETHGIPNDLI